MLCSCSLGERHVRGLQALTRLMSSHSRSSKPCPGLCVVFRESLVLEHVLSKHKSVLGLDLTVEQLTEEHTQDNLMSVCRFWNLYSRYYSHNYGMPVYCMRAPG